MKKYISRIALVVAASLGATAVTVGAIGAAPAIARPDSSGVPAWLVIGLYEGTIPESAISGFGYGDFDWAIMSPAQRLTLYNSAMREAQENS